MGEAFKYQSSWKTEDVFTKKNVNTLVSASYGIIPEYDSDPISPLAESSWILRTVGSGGTTVGVPMGLLLALTYSETIAGGATTYQFSYRTKESNTKRVTIS